MVAISKDLDYKTLAAAQRSDPILHAVVTKRETIVCWKLEKITPEEIPPNMVSAYTTSICSVLQSEDSNNE